MTIGDDGKLELINNDRVSQLEYEKTLHILNAETKRLMVLLSIFLSENEFALPSGELSNLIFTSKDEVYYNDISLSKSDIADELRNLSSTYANLSSGSRLAKYLMQVVSSVLKYAEQTN